MARFHIQALGIEVAVEFEKFVIVHLLSDVTADPCSGSEQHLKNRQFKVTEAALQKGSEYLCERKFTIIVLVTSR